MPDAQDFPDSWTEFLKKYIFNDSKQFHTNGSTLIKIQRIQEYIEWRKETGRMYDDFDPDDNVYGRVADLLYNEKKNHPENWHPSDESYFQEALGRSSFMKNRTVNTFKATLNIKRGSNE